MVRAAWSGGTASAAILGAMTSPVRPVDSIADLERELAGFVPGRSLLLIGGADFSAVDDTLVRGIRGFLAVLAGHCQRSGTAVVDGGTDAGVMRWFADARAAMEGSFPLVGVTPRFAFDRPTRTGRPIAVAPGHSIVLAVPGEQFGDERSWLFEAADYLGAGVPAPTVLVNGGELSAMEARERLAAGYGVLVVQGSGRAADELAAGADAAELRDSGRLRVIPLEADESAIAAAIEEPVTE